MFKMLGTFGASLVHVINLWRTSNRNRYKRWFTRTQQQRQWQRQVADLITTRKGLAWLCQWCPMSPTYRRPWFLMMGAPQSGKTAVIAQMFSPETSLSTQKMQWFQSQQAVCFEMTVATKQSSFLRSGHFLLSMLRHYRHRQPLDAVVWVIDLPNMLCQDEAQWLTQIKQGHHYFLTIQREVKKNIPMYLLFTKLDAVDHFEAFTQYVKIPNPIGLDGTKVNKQQASCQTWVAQQLEQLVQSWQRQRMHAWQTVTQLKDQLAVYDFPEQFNQAQQCLQRWFEHWLSVAIDVSLTGVFFSACLRTQSPQITRSLVDSTTAFLPISSTVQTSSSNDTHWVSLDCAWLFLHTNCVRRWRIGWMDDRTARWLRYIVISVALLFSGGWMHHAYQTVKTFLLELTQIQQSVERGQTTEASLPQTLIRHQQLMRQSQQRRWYRSLGLWQTQALERQTKHAVMRKLQTILLQTLPEHLVEALTTHHQQWAALSVEQRIEQYPLYAAYFDVYQWLHSLTLRPIHNAPWLKVALQQLLTTSVSTWPPQALQYVMDHYQPEPSKIQTTEETWLMQQVQKDLHTMVLQPAAHYQWLRLVGLTVDDNKGLREQPPLPFFYTVAGWQRWVRPMLIQRLNDPMWMQISERQRHRLAQQVIAQYVADVSKQWLQVLQHEWFLDAPQTLEQWFDEWTAWLDVQKKSATVLTVLKRQRVTLNQLQKQSNSVWDQWFLEQWQQPGVAWQALIESLQQAQSWQAAYAQLLQPFIDFVRQWHAHPQPGEFALQAVRQWQGTAQPLPWQQAQQQLMAWIPSVIKPEAQSILYAMLVQPIDQMQQWVMQSVRDFIEHRWQVEVVDVYQQTMAHRFPFSATTMTQAFEISLKQWVEFLQPEKGMVWRFYQQYYVPIQSLLPVDPQWRLLMRQLKQISEFFFNTQTLTPQLDLEILPTPHPQLQELRWVHGQQQGRYQNEPQQWQTLHWPPQGVPRLTLMSGRLLNDHWVHSPTFEGVWGLFRWLANATITSVDEQTLQVRWTLASTSVSPLTVTLFLRAADPVQAIVTLLTTTWQFPATLFNESPRG